MATPVIACARFRVRAGAARADVAAAAARSTAFLERRPGFNAREVGVSADGEWLDVIHWADLDAALAAAATFAGAPGARPFPDRLEAAVVRLRHFESVYRSGAHRPSGAPRRAGGGPPMPPTRTPRLQLAPVDLKPALRRLLSDYLRELATLHGAEAALDAAGHVPYRYFDGYWSEPERLPLAIWLGDELAGFCLLRDTGARWQVAEFYVVPGHRRAGVGAATVAAVEERCRAAGRHRELEAATLPWNDRARAFWLSQGFVTESVDDEQLVHLFDLGG